MSRGGDFPQRKGTEVNTIGFLISRKENEGRRALLPSDLSSVRNCSALFVEEGYAAHMNIRDEEYLRAGCNVVPRSNVFACDIICDPKNPDPGERDLFRQGQTLFGWIHAVQGRAIVDFLLGKDMTAVAWEDMFEDGRHCFWRNNEIAGEAAVLQALRYHSRIPNECRAAVIGLGNCGRGAFRMLSRLGVDVACFGRSSEACFRNHLDQFDIVVNAVLWDVFRKDHIIRREDLRRMKPGSMIIDVSCDEFMGVETSRSTTIADPIYAVDGITHYVVDHCPAIFYKSASESISAALAPHIDGLVEGRPDNCIEAATIIRGGRILDSRIERFQNRGAARLGA